MTSFFSPPGTSIRHAGPGPEPKSGREAEPRRWHSDKRSDPLAGPWFRPGHRLLVQGTGQREREGHTEGERCVKVRHDSVTPAAFFFWHLMRARSSRGGRWGKAGSEPGRTREILSQKVRVKVRNYMYSWQRHFGTNIKYLIHQMFWYVKYNSSPCCSVCSLLLKQVGNKGKLLVRTFFFFLQLFKVVPASL